MEARQGCSARKGGRHGVYSTCLRVSEVGWQKKWSSKAERRVALQWGVRWGKASIMMWRRNELWRKMEGDEPGIFQVECSCQLHGEGVTWGGKVAMKTSRSLDGDGGPDH